MFEWLNEGILIHDSSDLGSFDTTSFYTQIARQFGKFRPYARYQLFDINKDDPIMQITTSPGFQQTLSLGVRYNLLSSPQSSSRETIHSAPMRVLRITN